MNYSISQLSVGVCVLDWRLVLLRCTVRMWPYLASLYISVYILVLVDFDMSHSTWTKTALSHHDNHRKATMQMSLTLCFTLLHWSDFCWAQFRSRHRKQWQPLDYLYTFPPLSPSFSLSCAVCRRSFGGSVWFLSLFTCFSYWALLCQCCSRKLVAMLISLLEALRASRASILEKPISTRRATCGEKYISL